MRAWESSAMDGLATHLRDSTHRKFCALEPTLPAHCIRGNGVNTLQCHRLQFALIARRLTLSNAGQRYNTAKCPNNTIRPMSDRVNQNYYTSVLHRAHQKNMYRLQLFAKSQLPDPALVRKSFFKRTTPLCYFLGEILSRAG